jgi:hypothetical protein
MDESGLKNNFINFNVSTPTNNENRQTRPTENHGSQDLKILENRVRDGLSFTKRKKERRI